MLTNNTLGSLYRAKVTVGKAGCRCGIGEGILQRRLELLRAEHRELEFVLSSLDTLLVSSAGLWAIEPLEKAKLLAAKREAQEALAKALIPKDGTLDEFLGLLRAASSLCKLDEASGHACPLCKRDLGSPETELFKRYHKLLSDDLEQEIAALNTEITTAREFAKAVVQLDRSAWDKCVTIQGELLTTAKTGTDLIVASCHVTKAPTPEAKAAFDSLTNSASQWAIELEAKRKAIDAAAKGRDELIIQLTALRGELEPLEYAQAISDRLAELREARRIAAEAAFWNSTLPPSLHC